MPGVGTEQLDTCFADVTRLYRGEHPSYRACDTAYHNIQHVFDVTLAMVRLMNGYERSRGNGESIGSRRFVLAVVIALLHDVGYLRHVNDSRHSNGAQYTRTHVSRGARYIKLYLTDIGMPDFAQVAGEIVHFTGYERPTNRIRVPNNMFRLLGHMLGTADIMAQLADRCYLEKCRDRLFPEFVQGGLAANGPGDQRSGVLFTSVEDLIRKTPGFYKSAAARLDEQLGGVHKYMQKHFGGRDPYFEEIGKNIQYASRVAQEPDLTLLRRMLPRSDAGEE